MARLTAAQASVEAVVNGLEADGYCVVERYLDAKGVATARAGLEGVLEHVPSGRNAFEGYRTQRVYALFAKTRVFDEHAIDPLLLGVLDRTLRHYQLSAPTGIQIGPGEKAQILHRDDGIYPLPPGAGHVVLNTMWALDDFTEANGATRLVPGSHRWDRGRQPAPDEPTNSATMPAGSVMFYLGSIFHGGGANTTAHPRLGVILEYVAAWLRPQENHLLAVPRETLAALPERLQELLGCNVFPPFMGYVDGRHPRRYILEPVTPPAAGGAPR
jgi:ectoine hydroxylase-related dioxygenase (phytanoyl-CoA dioxygenase family)